MGIVSLPRALPSLPGAGAAVALLLGAAGLAAQDASEPAELRRARADMVEHQLAARDISDPRVLEVMGQVRRHLFVPERLTNVTRPRDQATQRVRPVGRYTNDSTASSRAIQSRMQYTPLFLACQLRPPAGGKATQHCHRLAPQDRRPRRRSEGPQRGWPIPPVRSDLVGKADKLLAATQPARPTPPVPFLNIR